MATYSNNTTIKINSAVNASATRTNNGTSIVYTVPANSNYQGHLFYNGSLGNAESITLTIGGFTVYNYFNSGAGPAFFNYTQLFNNLNLGPGTVIQFTLSGNATNTMWLMGTLFTNTP